MGQKLQLLGNNCHHFKFVPSNHVRKHGFGNGIVVKKSRRNMQASQWTNHYPRALMLLLARISPTTQTQGRAWGGPGHRAGCVGWAYGTTPIMVLLIHVMFQPIKLAQWTIPWGNDYISISRTCGSWNKALPTFVLKTMEVQVRMGISRPPVVWGLRQPAACRDKDRTTTHWTRDDLGHLRTCPLACLPCFLTVQWTHSRFFTVGNKGAAPYMATSEPG